MGKRATVVLVAAIAALSACGGGTNTAADKPAPGRTTIAPEAPTRPATTTTTTPEYSFDDSVPPPKLINTGTNYVAILKSLESYANWLAAHRPDPALTSTIVARGTRLYELYVQDYTRLRANTTRGIEKLGGPSKYTILSTTSRSFSARVVEQITSHKTVVTGGRITSEIRFSEPTTYLDIVVLVDGRWHLAAVEVQHTANVHL